MRPSKNTWGKSMSSAIVSRKVPKTTEAEAEIENAFSLWGIGKYVKMVFGPDDMANDRVSWLSKKTKVDNRNMMPGDAKKLIDVWPMVLALGFLVLLDHLDGTYSIIDGQRRFTLITEGPLKFRKNWTFQCLILTEKDLEAVDITLTQVTRYFAKKPVTSSYTTESELSITQRQSELWKACQRTVLTVEFNQRREYIGWSYPRMTRALVNTERLQSKKRKRLYEPRLKQEALSKKWEMCTAEEAQDFVYFMSWWNSIADRASLEGNDCLWSTPGILAGYLLWVENSKASKPSREMGELYERLFYPTSKVHSWRDLPTKNSLTHIVGALLAVANYRRQKLILTVLGFDSYNQ